MCKNCLYWYMDADLKPRCHVDTDAGKYGPSACDAEFDTARIHDEKGA